MEAPVSLPAAGAHVKYIAGTVKVSDVPTPATFDVALGTSGRVGDLALDLVTEDENSKMQIRWNKVMCEEMKIPQGYQNISVLIIKWAEEIDQLKCAKEVDEVKQIFTESFKYPTKVIELNNTTSPQLQLELEVMSFVSKYNGQHNLFIIYYSGHGSYDEKTEELRLHASDELESMPAGTYPALAVWNKAEKSLIDHAECDMLTIFDACYASNIHKAVQRQDPRTYEMLTATGHDKTTAGPGPRSFTAALIGSLQSLLEEHGDEPFTTRQLCEKINLHPMRRKNQSHIWSRFKRFDRSITLAPLKNSLDERKKDFSDDKTRSLLTLTLPLTVKCLSDDQIESLSRALSKAVKDVRAPVKRLDWRKLRSSGRTTNFANLTRARGVAKRWLSIHQAKKFQSPAPAQMRDQPSQTTHEVHETTGDGCQTTEPDTTQMKRKDPSDRNDALISPFKRSRTEEEKIQTSTDLHYHPPTPPDGTDID